MAQIIADDLAGQTAKRPLFLFINWVNWFTSPTSMLETMQILNSVHPGEYEVVGMPEYVALAQRAKKDGLYPMQFVPNGAADWAYYWSDPSVDGSTTNAPHTEPRFRATSGDATATYKFNVAPALTGSVTVDIRGEAYRVDASPDGITWTVGVIEGSSVDRVVVTTDVSANISSTGILYLRLAGESALFHVEVEVP